MPQVFIHLVLLMACKPSRAEKTLCTVGWLFNETTQTISSLLAQEDHPLHEDNSAFVFYQKAVAFLFSKLRHASLTFHEYRIQKLKGPI